MANELKVSGKILNILPMQSGTSHQGNGWKKQDVIIETDGDYPKKICVSFWNDKISDSFSVGQPLTAHINIESREYNGKWYTDVKAWKYDGMVQQEQSDNSQNQEQSYSAPEQNGNGGGAPPDDDLPF